MDDNLGRFEGFVTFTYILPMECILIMGSLGMKILRQESHHKVYKILSS